jgi:hypothetical protein
VKKWLEENDKIIPNFEFRIGSLFDGPENIDCENCSVLPALFWCESCSPGIHYCKPCDFSVHSSKALRNHIRIPIEEKSKRPILAKCETHGEEKKFYCLECRMVICGNCLIDEHPHKTTGIFKYAEKLREDLKNKIVYCNLKINDLNDKVEKISLEITQKEMRRNILLEELNHIENALQIQLSEKKK